ncbi:hypothetical protein [Streptomyces sp. NPDC003023]|uniref:hypothetical protein n=1 Tax=Streptomyces sp. NPDC003023 TaxID=3364675 RepID=UPI00369E0BAD
MAARGTDGMSADGAREDAARTDGVGEDGSRDDLARAENAGTDDAAADDALAEDAAEDTAEDAAEDTAGDGERSDEARPDRTRRPGLLTLLRRLGGRTAAAAGRGKALPVTLAVATVAVTALSGWLCVQVYEQRAEARQQQDILAAARQSALNFTSLDYRHYDRDSKNVLKGATGEFKEQFASQTAELTKLVAANKSVSEGQVLEAGIARSDERSARVLVVADSKVTNTAAPEGQSRTYRLQLDLVLERGRWLTSAVEFVG